ncbi:MAG TPA: polyprenyl diphosphate synthase [Dehalococcoidia bacterium]
MVAEPAAAPDPLPDVANVPRHVAIIMDGNGRWARQRGLSRQAGHRAGTENIRRIIEHFGRRGVQCLTLYAFSTENWGRPKSEVRGLFQLISRVINRELAHLHEQGVRLVHLGRLDGLSPKLQKQVLDAIELTKDNRRMTVAVAFNYGGRAEILDAVRRMLKDEVRPDQVDEALLGRYLYTAGLPDPDLIIRTAGEERISNFLIWQAAYAELYFTDVYWPDFDQEEADKALRAYSRRVRRFGGLPQEEQDAPRRRRGRLLSP